MTRLVTGHTCFARLYHILSQSQVLLSILFLCLRNGEKKTIIKAKDLNLEWKIRYRYLGSYTAEPAKAEHRLWTPLQSSEALALPERMMGLSVTFLLTHALFAAPQRLQTEICRVKCHSQTVLPAGANRPRATQIGFLLKPHGSLNISIRGKWCSVSCKPVSWDLKCIFHIEATNWRRGDKLTNSQRYFWIVVKLRCCKLSQEMWQNVLV